ncbi:arylsulfatase [Arundinibacter roseus]|uniref:N-acetylgalactosamine-6-sulfatase n=1 Tax=Arundinibacter roseus TaxID=2070510 RepID=A0A4R4KLQ8_9BACT|nr:arylsulfatase [Arundinibacter roseus]TDB67906.1 N-acetylgalactosamine-6-sulfatase [Arundinibacter roseus]
MIQFCSFLILLFYTLTTGLWGFDWFTNQAKPHRPNVVYIFADDLGYAELGAYGQKKIRTPHLDLLAKEGIKFTNYYTGTPVCAPSRCQLMTGLHAGHSYIRGNFELGGFPDSTERGQMPLPENTLTLGKIFQEAGYKTACIGKWGLGMGYSSGSPNKQGFDYFYGYYDQKQSHNYYPTHLWENGQWDTLQNPVMDVHRRLNAETATEADFAYFKGKDFAIDKMAEKALNFIRQNKEKPFFLYLPFTIPHVSLQAPDAAVAEYKGQFEETPYYGQNGYASTPYPRATYAAMITYMDKKIGEVMALLKEQGLDENTLVIFTSDNGTTFNGGVDAAFFESVGAFRGLKMDVYEGGIRMPMLARWPGKIAPGSVTDHVGAHYDVLATMVDLLQKKPVPGDGISFLPTLLGRKNQKKHEFLYWEYPEKGGQVAVRLGKWKGVKVDMKKNQQAAWELYDLEKDASETANLAAQHPEIINRMDQIVQTEHRPSHVSAWEFVR